MSRKDYIAAAQLILARGWKRDVADAFAEFFARDNPNFHRLHFMAAAGFTSKPSKGDSRPRARR